MNLARRSTDSRPAIARDRFGVSAPRQSDHMRGWVHASMGMVRAANESPEFNAGAREWMNACVSQITATE